MDMDAKDKLMVQRYHNKLVAHECDEDDVYATLILLRECSSKSSPLREVADFIAHRERDRGAVFQYLSDTKKQFINASQRKPFSLTINEVYSEHEFTDALNAAFSIMHLANITPEAGSMAMACVISLLQGARFREDDQILSTLRCCRPYVGNGLALECRIPIPVPDGSGWAMTGFMVLRSSFCPEGITDVDLDTDIIRLVRRNEQLTVTKDDG